MMPLQIRTTQASADEGRLKVQVGGKSKAAKRKKLISLIKDSAVRNYASGKGG